MKLLLWALFRKMYYRLVLTAAPRAFANDIKAVVLTLDFGENQISL